MVVLAAVVRNHVQLRAMCSRGAAATKSVSRIVRMIEKTVRADGDTWPLPREMLRHGAYLPLYLVLRQASGVLQVGTSEERRLSLLALDTKPEQKQQRTQGASVPLSC